MNVSVAGEIEVEFGTCRDYSFTVSSSSMKPQANKISPEQREQALLAMGLAGKDEAVCELKLNGQVISNEMRDELLRKCAANEYVELTLDVIAYEQKEGV